MNASRAEGLGPAEVQVVLNAGLASLKDWLEPHLKHQEKLLERLTKACELGGGLGCSDGAPLKEGSHAHTMTIATAQACKAGGGSGSGNRDVFNDEADSIAMPVAKAHYQPAQSKPELRDADCQSKSRPLERGPERNVDIFLPGQVLTPPLQKEPGHVVEAPSAWQDAEQGPNANEHGCTKARPKVEVDNQEWQLKMMDIFDQIDVDMSGNIDRRELLEACNEVGFPQLQSLNLFAQIDKSSNSVIDRMEWLQLVVEARHDDGSNSDMELLVDFLTRLSARQESAGHIYKSGSNRRKPFLILRHDHWLRTAWDILMMLLLLWIAVTMPFSMGFGTNEFLATFDNISNMVFCFDVCLNFRTSYADYEGQIIFNSKKIAGNYLRSWFLLDFVSSFPFDMVTEGILPNMAPARLLKIGKIAKVLKLLRMTRVKRISELTYEIEDKSTPKFLSSVWRVSRLIIITFVMCHWLACFMAAVDMGGLDRYLGEDAPIFSLYLAALYWAMTTLTTVGYGDITPKSDFGRAYYMIAMVVGGAFYGYMIQSVAAVMSDDLNQKAYLERMSLVTSWLEAHEKDLPTALRRRIRKHCKEAFLERAAIDDAAVIADLSPELQADTAFFIIDEKVRRNPVFVDLPNSGLASLVPIMKKVLIGAASHAVSNGDPGVAMYILADGRGRFDSGFMWIPAESNRERKRFQPLNVGDSFGEEIIFGLEEKYMYTIVAISPSTFFTISEDGFKDQFRNLPDLQNLMYRSFLKSRSGSAVDVEEEESAALRLVEFKYKDR